MHPSRGRHEDEDRTQSWDRVAGPGMPPVRGLPPVPARRAAVQQVDRADTDLRRDDQHGQHRDDDGGHEHGLDHDGPLPDGPDGGVAPPREPLWQVAARGVGQLLVTAGLVVLLFVFYEVHVTDFLNDRTQGRLSDQVHDQWDAAPPVAEPVADQVAPPVEQPVAVVHVPRLGPDYQRVVLEGTTEDELSRGPGHYVGSALPGQQGNGGAADAAPDGAYLTLTTCHPKYSARQRLVVHAVLDGGPISKAEAPDGPPALQEG